MLELTPLILRTDPPYSIYLADTADGQTGFRKRIAADLKERGIKILDVIPPPYYDSSDHQQRMQDTLEKAQLSIHLLNEYPGREIQGLANSSYPCEQVKLGFSAKAKQLIWIPQELEIAAIEEPYYQDWLSQLESGERQEKDYQFIRSSQSALTDLILQEIEIEIEKLQNDKPPAIIEQSFLIDTHQMDQQYAYQLAGMMAAQGIDVEFNKESKDPVESLNFFEKSVQQVPNLILIFGRVSPKWLAERIKRAVKISAMQFEMEAALQIEKIWIFLTPECGGQNTLPALPRLIPISLLDNSSTASIDLEIIGALFSGGDE